jgi:hypothetical protein
MGVVWLTGSRYVGPFGAVYWLRLSNRHALHDRPLGVAAFLWNLPTRINFPDLSIPPPDPNPGLAPYGNERVVAWNGGKADEP